MIKIKNFKTIYIHIKKTSLHEVSISSESFYYQYFYNEHVSSNFNNIIKYNRIWIMNFCSTKNSFFFYFGLVIRLSTFKIPTAKEL